MESKATASDALKLYLEGYTTSEIREMIGVRLSAYESLITNRVKSIHNGKRHQWDVKRQLWIKIQNEAARLVAAGYGSIEITEK